METIHFNECKLCIKIYDSFITAKGGESIIRKNGSIFSFLSTTTQGYNEKRFVEIAISKPFEIGRLPQSASYDSIYRSEVIDSSVDLHPSLAASFFYPAGLDVNIKVTLWYSSSLTRNKVIVLGYSINNLLQLMNGDANKTMVQHLISEYPLAAKSCLQILPSFPPVFVDKYLAPLAPSYRSNPLQQSYVFYCDSESAGDEPVVVVDEFAWEPRLSMKVSLLYLESCLNALLVSHKAWVGRRQAEMTRLGVFESPEIAFQCGWQQISIRIPSAMLTVSRHRVRRESISASMASAMSTAKYSYLLPASSSGNGASLLSFPSDLSVAAIESSYIERLNTLVASRDRIRQTANFGRVDESLPCTYIEIYIEDREQTFSSFVGRTNVELHTLHPVYGSNINSHSATSSSDGSHYFPVATDGSTCVREACAFPFQIVDTGDRQFMNGDQNTNPTASETCMIDGIATTLQRFVSPSTSHIRLEVFEISEKKPIRVAVTRVAIDAALCSPSLWINSITAGSSSSSNQKSSHRNSDALTNEISLPLHPQYNFESVSIQMSVKIQTGVGSKSRVSLDNDKFTASFIDDANDSATDLLGLHDFDGDASTRVPGTARSDASLPIIAESVITRHAAASMPCSAVLPRYTNGVLASTIATLRTSRLDRDSPCSKTARSRSGSVDSVSSNPQLISAYDCRELIGHSYDWLWNLGLTGIDPLAADIDKAYSEQNPNLKLNSVLLNPHSDSSISRRPSQSNLQANSSQSRLLNQSVQSLLRMSSDQSMSADMPELNLSCLPRQLDYMGNSALSGSVNFLISRVDVPYSLDWIDAYIVQLEDIINQVAAVLSEADAFNNRPHAEAGKSSRLGQYFRPSILKKEMFAQALPKNLHIQALLVRRHNDVSGHCEVLDSVTCGCFSPHGLSTDRGGIMNQEEQLLQSRVILNSSKQAYHNLICTNKVYRWGISPDNSSLEFRTQNILRDNVQAYEMDLLSMARRKIFPLAQVLSVAANAVIAKLSLLLEDQLPAGVAERWFSSGFLIVFESLLSVIGGERTMIEDSVAVINSLQHFKIRFQNSTTVARRKSRVHENLQELLEGDGLASAAECGCEEEQSELCPRSQTQIHAHDEDVEELRRKRWNCSLSTEDRRTLICERVKAQLKMNRIGYKSSGRSRTSTHDSISSAVTSKFFAGNEALSIYGLDNSHMDVAIKGREIIIYLPAQVLSRLPSVFRERLGSSEGAIMSLVPALFTQGIDLHQTVAQSISSSDTASLQYQLNTQALQQLNRYCHRALPIPTASQATPAVGVASSSRKDDIASTIPSTPPRSLPFMNTQTTQLSYASLFPHFNWPPGSGSGQEELDDETKALRSTLHPSLIRLEAAMSNSKDDKNVDMLEEATRACQFLCGARVTFCKSGKDRTGMAVTLFQSMQLGEQFGCGKDEKRIIRDVTTMRVHGVRILVAEKNIGRKVFSINLLQVQFLPKLYRPPQEVCESMLRKDNS